MGCWNQTCSVSNLPIVYGDEVVLIPLISTGGLESCGMTYYPTDFFIPLCMPLYGEYNDYGGIENIKTNVANENFLKQLNICCEEEEYEITEDEIVDAFKKAMFKDIGRISQSLLDVMPKQRIEWENIQEFADNITYKTYMVEYRKNPNGEAEYRVISYMMIHKELYNAMIKNISKRIPYNNDKCYRDLYYGKIMNYILDMRRKNEESKKIVESASTEEEKKNMAVIQNMLNSYPFNNHASNLNIVDSIAPSIGYNYFIERMIEEDNPELMEEILDSIMFRVALSLSRRGYLTNTGLGSQSQEYQIHQIIADFVESHINKVVNKAKQEDENISDDFLSETLFWFDK